VLCIPFLSNGTVNETVFYGVRAATVTLHLRGKQSSTTIEGLGFLCGPCRRVILKTIGATQAVVGSWQLSTERDSSAKRCSRLRSIIRKVN
jgi:hypothetical protein